MRLLNFLLIGLIVATTATFSSCSKETRMEKNLCKKGGEWNIERFNSQQSSTFTPDNFNSTEYNYGTFTFQKGGTGTYVFTVDGYYESGVLNYSNIENQLLISYDNNNYVFDINWGKKDITITRTESYTNSVGSGIYTETYNLKRK